MSTDPLGLIVKRALSELTPVTPVGDGFLVTTHCLYPSNASVQVLVHGRGNAFAVSDGGGAITEFESAGGAIENPHKVMRSLLKPYGLSMNPAGQVVSATVPQDWLAATILAVANASRETAQWLFDTSKVKPNRDFKGLVRRYLESHYADVQHDASIHGRSNAPHRFANLLVISDGRRLIIDPVVNDANSINSRVVAHLDVKQANVLGLEQRLVIDDDEGWKSASINMLTIGAPVVRFSALDEALKRLAA